MRIPLSKIDPKAADDLISVLSPQEVDHLHYLAFSSPSFHRYRFFSEAENPRYQRTYIESRSHILSPKQVEEFALISEEENSKRMKAIGTLLAVGGVSLLISARFGDPKALFRRKIMASTLIGILAGGSLFQYGRVKSDASLNRLFYQVLQTQTAKSESNSSN